MINEPKEYAFRKFTDSYIMHYKHIPKFLFWIILCFLTVIIGIIVWSAFVTKPYVVKAQSIITVKDKTGITVAANGNIKSVNIFEGKKVSAGEVLIEQETLEIDLQIKQLETSLSYYNNRVLLYDRLIYYIQNDYGKDEESNSFDQDNISELEFYNYMNSYELEKEQYLGNQALLASFKIQTLNTYLTQRNLQNKEYNNYLTQKQSYEESKETYIIRANSSGIIHLNAALHKGLFLQAGAGVGTIVSDMDELIAECYLTAADRPKIKTGDKIKIAINGLSQNEYGVLTGELISVDSDATVSESGSFFKAIIRLDKDTISSDKNTINLSFGMQAEARIIYEETTYLKYFLEQIGIKIK